MTDAEILVKNFENAVIAVLAAKCLDDILIALKKEQQARSALLDALKEYKEGSE